MRTKTWIAVLAFGVGLAAGWTAATRLEAQQTGIKRTLLLKTELTGIDGREVYLGTAEIAPGASAGRHFHDGHEIGYVLEGAALFEVEGQAPRTLAPGDHYHVDAGKRHDARNTGTAPAKILGSTDRKASLSRPHSVTPTLAFVGLGAMGGRMAKRLLDAGHPVVGYNRTRAKARPLVEAGMRGRGRPGRPPGRRTSCSAWSRTPRRWRR